MPHEYAGHYRTKHPQGTPSDPAIAAALEAVASDSRLSCTAAHEVAEKLSVAPAEVGKTADLLELRVVECQMGLFGYAPEKRTVKPAQEIPSELRESIEKATVNGRITCAACWKIARDLSVKKMTVSCACEAMGLKVKNCQIGAF
jgi:hypothetical protein